VRRARARVRKVRGCRDLVHLVTTPISIARTRQEETACIAGDLPRSGGLGFRATRPSARGKNAPRAARERLEKSEIPIFSHLQKAHKSVGRYQLPGSFQFRMSEF
jgi:hypothetical protein